MQIQEIEVRITADGEVVLEVRGAKGTTCLALTEDLEKALGGDIDNREMTAEAAEPDEAGEAVRLHTGNGSSQ